jgi:hypothetical protein
MKRELLARMGASFAEIFPMILGADELRFDCIFCSAEISASTHYLRECFNFMACGKIATV